jgi:hypothetical protein
MADIQWIYNVTACSTWAGGVGSYIKPISPPDFTPDEVVIRSINFNGLVSDTHLYVIWCNIINDNIGSFCGGTISPQSPQTRIWIRGQIPNNLEFRLQTPTVAAGLQPVTAMTGDLAITMDFIKYKRTST